MRLSIVLKYLSITAFFIAIISLIGFKLFFQKGVGLDNANRSVVAQLQLPAENEVGKFKIYKYVILFRISHSRFPHS